MDGVYIENEQTDSEFTLVHNEHNESWHLMRLCLYNLYMQTAHYRQIPLAFI